MNLSQEQRETLKKLITEDAYGYLSDIEDAKIDLKATAQIAKDNFGVEISMFNKLAKTYYLSSLDEEEAKLSQFKEIYKELLEE